LSYYMGNEEIEIKLDLVNEGNYRCLIDHFGVGEKTRLQENYFYDSPDRVLAACGWALRVRIEENTAYLTIKGHASGTNDGVTTRLEIEETVLYSLAEEFVSKGIIISQLPDKIRATLADLPDNLCLTQLVFFRNYRTTIPFTDCGLSLEIEIDRTEFADGTVDYEIEVELPHQDVAKGILSGIHRLMKTLDIPIIPQKEGKLSRALKRKPNT